MVTLSVLFYDIACFLKQQHNYLLLKIYINGIKIFQYHPNADIKKYGCYVDINAEYNTYAYITLMPI